MLAACCITLRDFPGVVGSLPINGSINANGLVIAEVYKPGKSVYFTTRVCEIVVACEKRISRYLQADESGHMDRSI